MRDIFFHTQWCAALGMVAVQWPDFVCEQKSQDSKAIFDRLHRPITCANIMGYPNI